MGIRQAASALAALMVLTGCAASPAADPAASAVRSASSALGSFSLVVRQRLEGRATGPFSQVAMEESVAAVAQAQRELTTADGVDPRRREVAAAAIGDALDVLRPIVDRGSSGLTQADLAGLTEAQQALSVAATELA